MSKVLVSIIIPTFNRAHIIGETLDSVFAQTYSHWECIVVDDSSTDNTVEVLKEYIGRDARFYCYCRPKNRHKGANACRNYGFELSSGEYVLFLDSDDILKRNCVSSRLDIFNRNKKLDFVIANTAFYANGVFFNKPICNYPNDFKTKNYLELFLKYELPWVSTMSVLWKRESISNINFDERLTRLQDVDFHIQVLLQDDLKCIRLNEIDTFYRSERGSRTSFEQQQNVVKASKLFFKKYLEEHYLDSNQKKQFRYFIILFLIKYIYPFQKEQKEDIDQIDTIIKASKIFSFKELILLGIYKFIIGRHLHTKSGLGMHKLTKVLKKGLKYD